MEERVITSRGYINPETNQVVLDKDDIGYASDGKPVQFVRKDTTGKPIPAQPGMHRDTSRKNVTVQIGDWNLTYDEEGYCTNMVNTKSLHD